MDYLHKTLTQKLVSLADACLALLEKRGAVINGKSATELREKLRRARAKQLNQAEDQTSADAGSRNVRK